MIKRRLMTILGILLISSFALTACGGGNDAEATPTMDPLLIQTQAVETFSAILTQTALAAPTNTPVPTLTIAAPTFPPLATNTLGAALPTFAATSSGSTANACYGMTFVSDVNFPDNTAVTPGQSFTKTWKVKNSGTCAWDAGFKFAFTAGNAMNGTAYTVPASVAVGAVVDISIAMTAPTTAGKVQSNWRMSTAGGQFFGNEVYVIVVVGGSTVTATSGAAINTSAPATATATSTSTSTPTPTNTIASP